MIDMPPRRHLPQQVRDSMLVDLRQKLDETPRRAKTPYAVAAGVAALVAGGVVAVTTLQGGGDGTETGSGKVTGDTNGVAVQAHRCQSASKKAGGFPAKADWRVVAHTASAGFTELAVKVADKPVFCEVTATSVRLSEFDTKPNYVPGSKTGAAFKGGSNLVGLVVDPSWHGIDAYEKTGKDELIDSDPTQEGTTGWRYADGMALWWPEYPVALTVAPHGKKPTSPLPAAPDSTVTVVDQPYTGPAPDRTSPEGKLLVKCIERSASWNPLVDPATWQPGPMLTGDTSTILVIRGIDHVTTCSGDPADTRAGGLGIDWWGGDLRVVGLPKGNKPVVSLAGTSLTRDNENRDIVFGSVSKDAASMTVTTSEHDTATAQVHNGTFIADVRQTPDMLHDDIGVYPVITSVTVKDAHGKVLYQGKPQVSP
jgi:hypothetical protein